MILENPPPFPIQIVGKMPKAHAKGIVNLQFIYNGAHVALCSVSMESIKVWALNDIQEENIVVFTQMNEYAQNVLRHGVISASTLPSASCTGVVGGDSIIYSLEADDDGSHIRTYDMGYMEAWHIVALEPGRFITTSFSGYLSEVVDGKFGLREQFPKIKSVICMNLSPSGQTLALGGNEGAVDIVDVKTLKIIHTLEAHWTRITSILLLSDSELLTGGIDKYIKYYDKISAGSHHLERTLCGHRGAVSCMVAAPSIGNTRKFASASLNGQVILWNLDATGSPLTHIDVPHEGSIVALAFSPCGQFLVSGGDDKLVAVYRVAADPLDKNVPLLNSGLELLEMEAMKMNGGKENVEPVDNKEDAKDGIKSEEDMDVDNGHDATTRDLFGDSSDSEGESRREVEEDEMREEVNGENGASGGEREERAESEERAEEGGGGGDYEGYGRDEDGEERVEDAGYEEEERREYVEEERDGDGEERGEDERMEMDDREEEEEEHEEQEREGEEGVEDEQREEYTRREDDEEERRSENGEDNEDEGERYVPSIIKKEEPMHEGYGDSPSGDRNPPPTTPPYEEE